MKKQILNIVNFIRNCEPRDPSLDLHRPVAEQARLSRQYQLPTTFLLQYDALLDPFYTALLKGEPLFQLGIWLEIVQPQAEDSGMQWRGRYPWDWRVEAGFTIGYTPAERMKLVDTQMERFRAVYGEYPRTAGAWYFDAFTARYLAEKYRNSAMCNCRDQWGTDGYTLWGGYYNQAYYPSKYNCITPAQTEANQVKVPVFCMLGSDPIRQYDFGLTEGGPARVQGVATLEPVYGSYGANADWVDWFFREIYNGECLAFGYAQAGQENSFGWDAMGPGYTMQMEKISRLRAEGRLEVLTLAEAGDWFRETYALTPASSIVARDERTGQTSVWYDCKNYRVNLYAEDGVFRIRDFQLFDERYRELFLDTPSDGRLIADNLPVMDGNTWSKGRRPAGVYFEGAHGPLTCTGPLRTEEDGGSILRAAVPTAEGELLLTLAEEGVTVEAPACGELILEFYWSPEGKDIAVTADGQRLHYRRGETAYALELAGAEVLCAAAGKIRLRRAGGAVRLCPAGLE